MNSLKTVNYVSCRQSKCKTCRIRKCARCKLSSNNKILIINWFW